MDSFVTVTAVGGSLLIRSLGMSWHIHRGGEEYVRAARAISPQVIFACWHSRLLPLCWTHRGRHIHVLASEHRDGETLARAISWLGFRHVRGSSETGGMRAVRRLVRVVERGGDLGIPVDGPHGPRGIVKRGVVTIARLTGAGIIPLSSAASYRATADSWDRFEVPGPFAHVWVRHGEPIFVSRDAGERETELARGKLETELAQLTEEVDRCACR